jgi:hypothetical protein
VYTHGGGMPDDYCMLGVLASVGSRHRPLEPDPLHLVLREPLARAIVKVGRAPAFMRRHFLRVLERAAIGGISRNPCGPKRVIADRGIDAGRLCSPADHEPGV